MISYIHSTTVFVSDQDRAIDFYVSVLGFEKREDAPYAQGARWVTVAPPGERTSLTLQLPDVDNRSGQAGHYTGISLISDDLQATYDQLVAKGVQFTSPPQLMPWGALATWFNDPDGNGFFLTSAQ